MSVAAHKSTLWNNPQSQQSVILEPGAGGPIAATVSGNTALVLYEYPFNEGIRTMLRLEHLFHRLTQLIRSRW